MQLITYIVWLRNQSKGANAMSVLKNLIAELEATVYTADAELNLVERGKALENKVDDNLAFLNEAAKELAAIKAKYKM